MALCPIFLGFLGGFLLSKALTGWPLFYLEVILILYNLPVTSNATKWDLLTCPINDACSESIHKHSFSLHAKYWVAPKEPNGLMEQVYGPRSLQVG